MAIGTPLSSLKALTQSPAPGPKRPPGPVLGPTKSSPITQAPTGVAIPLGAFSPAPTPQLPEGNSPGPQANGPGPGPGQSKPGGPGAPLAPKPNPGNPIAPQPPKPPAASLEFRSFDGSGNNLVTNNLNAVGSDFRRLGPAHFADGVNAMVTDLPNARTVSNLVVAGGGEIANPEGLSGMMYAWGQFIDHDLNLMRSDGINHIDISIPSGDPNLSASSISLTRTIIDPLTGLAGKPAAAVNTISGWLDGSMVYGSDASTAASLRNGDGTMKTSAGNNLPVSNGMFLAGDIRVQENPDLTAIQTLFVREHNRQVDLLKAAHPQWSGDQLYNQARAIVGAEIAKITYSEFLPHLLGKQAIKSYQGYKAGVDASISEEFAGAAFRFGHSIVSDNLQRIDESGAPVGSDLSLKDAFFLSPTEFATNGGADGFLRKLSSDISNALDVHIVDDLRNFLNVPGAAMDLAAINIQRGRDLGLGSLNETRVALGLKSYTSFSQISADPSVVSSLQAAYGSVDKLDLWIGGLAENHAKGAMVGETFQKIIAGQFTALRDGDRLWYQNQGFDAATLQQIDNTSLADLILLNTDTDHIQPDVFSFMGRHNSSVSAEDPTAPQLIVGKNGGDTLVGGSGNDILVAGLGRQAISGGAGRDAFVLSQGGIQARISDFTPGQDQLVFEQAATTDQLNRGLTVTRQGNDSLLRFQGSEALLVGLTPNQLRHGDLAFQL